jgi:hypothetical protein
MRPVTQKKPAINGVRLKNNRPLVMEIVQGPQQLVNVNRIRSSAMFGRGACQNRLAAESSGFAHYSIASDSMMTCSASIRAIDSARLG